MDYYNSVETVEAGKSLAVFIKDSSAVFRDDVDIVPQPISDKVYYMPWGADNRMPYDILDLIERDETLSTCQIFNAEVCYGSGLTYSPAPERKPKPAVEDFLERNDMASYWLGVCQDFKHFGFAVSVIILNSKGTKILRLARKEAIYCRFAPADKHGVIPSVIYANWRKGGVTEENAEVIPLLNPVAPLDDLQRRIQAGDKQRKYAVLTKIPTADSTYYPVPHYAAIFRGKWYNIKQLIGVAKEAKLKNSAPIKYQIEICDKYWEEIFRSEGITDRDKQRDRVIKEKRQIIDFLTGAENSGKAWFSTYYVSPDGQARHNVIITKIEQSKEGGDWTTDIQEAVNMICFTLRVHSNLVGSVPGSAQTNNSGSDKRELYTIAHALQKPYHDILFAVHRLIIRFNGWSGYRPESPFIQLTTLDEHVDAKQVTPTPSDNENTDQ